MTLSHAHGEYRMYWKLRFIAITFLLIFGFAQPTLAGLAEDQYAVAAHHYSNGRWELAVEEFTQFLQEYPDHERAEGVVFFLAESLVQVGQFQNAHDRFAEYLQRSPEGKYATQGQFRAGETLYLDGQHEKARVYLERFVAQHPGDALCGYAHPYLGEIALVASESEKARLAFEQGLKQFPNGPLAAECRFGLARALEAQGDLDGALRFYQFLGESEHHTSINDDALLQMAIILYQQQQFDKAIATLERQREQYPGSELAAHAAYWLGLSQTSTGKYREAAETLASAAKRFQDHELAPAMEFASGEACRKMNDRSAAQRCYQHVVSQYAESTWADDSLQKLVQLAWAAGDYDAVTRLAEQFAGQYPTSPLLELVQQTAARAYLKQGQYDQAIQLLEPCLAATLRSETSPVPLEPLKDSYPSAVAPQVTASATIASTRYYLALALLGAKRHSDALEQLELLSDVHEPQELVSGVQVARASALLGLERYEQAIETLQLYLAAEPNGPDAEKCRAQLAVTCARLERWSALQPVFEQMQSGHTDQHLYLASLEYMAEAAYSKGQRELATSMFRELARDGNPEKFIAQGISGLAWLDWTREGGAVGSANQFERLLKRFPDSPLAAEAAMMRGQALEKANKLEGALAMYRMVMDRYADSVHAGTAMLSAARLFDVLQQDAEAEPLLRQWLAQHPVSDQRPGALYQLAWVLVDLQRESEADEVFQQIFEQCASSRYWSDATYRLAERAARAKDYVRAETLTGEIIERAKEPKMVAYSLYLRGQLAAADKRWGDVIEPMQRLLSDHPDSSHQLLAEYWLAEAYYRQRQYAEAGELFDKLDQQTQGQTDEWVAMIPLRRAQVMAHRHQWDESFEIASQIESRFPDFSQQHEVDYLLGRYHASRGEFDEAREAYQRVIRSETGRGAETAAVAQWMIGETYFMQKQYNQAIKAYHRVEGIYDFPRWEAAALLQAGKCHEMVGRWAEATELYSKIVTEYGNTSFVEKASRRLSVAQQRAGLMQTR